MLESRTKTSSFFNLMGTFYPRPNFSTFSRRNKKGVWAAAGERLRDSTTETFLLLTFVQMKKDVNNV